MMEEFERAWIVSNDIQPEQVEIIKKTKKESKIKINEEYHKTMPNDLIFDDFNSCLKDCIRKNYRYLQAYAQSCADLMDKIKKQEAKLDAERLQNARDKK